MNKFLKLTLFNIVFLVLFASLYFHEQFSRTIRSKKIGPKAQNKFSINNEQLLKTNITIAITICGNSSLLQGLNALKSALIFSKAQALHFILMTDQEMFQPISDKLKVLHKSYATFSYELHRIQYPDIEPDRVQIWRKLFTDCSTQRLFFPKIFPNMDSLIYVDADTLFLSPPEELWKIFGQLNSSQLMAISNNSANSTYNWYHNIAQHPYYGKFGLNSGVLLMNLTRMRTFGWTKTVEQTFLKYKNKLRLGDQDIINIIFHSNPDKVFVLGCNWNFRTDYCWNSLTCDRALSEGVKLLHGSRSVFLKDNEEPQFKALFKSFQQFDPAQHKLDDLVRLSTDLIALSVNSTDCSKVAHLLLQSMNNLVK